MPDEFTYRSAKENIEEKLGPELAAMFDQVAKIAMRASAEFSDSSTDLKVLQKIQKAHSVVTLIIDDAMRGLNKATTLALSFGVMAGLEASEEGESSSPH
jgi:hypothetical protein